VYYNSSKIGQGRENVKKYLRENPEIAEEIEKKVRDNYNKAFEQALSEDSEETKEEEE